MKGSLPAQAGARAVAQSHIHGPATSIGVKAPGLQIQWGGEERAACCLSEVPERHSDSRAGRPCASWPALSADGVAVNAEKFHLRGQSEAINFDAFELMGRLPSDVRRPPRTIIATHTVPENLQICESAGAGKRARLTSCHRWGLPTVEEKLQRPAAPTPRRPRGWVGRGLPRLGRRAEPSLARSPRLLLGSPRLKQASLGWRELCKRFSLGALRHVSELG